MAEALLPGVHLTAHTRERRAWWLPLLTHPGAMVAITVLHAAWGILLAVLLFVNLHMFVWDVGVHDQVVWNTAHGRWFASSVEVRNFLGDHFCPILAVFAGLHYIIPSPYCLFLVQQMCFSLSGLWVARRVRRQTRSVWLGWAAGLLVWCHPAALGVPVRDFQVLTLALPLTLALYWCGRLGRAGWVALCALLLMTVREDTGVAITAVGMLLCFEPQRRRIGAALFVIGGLWSALALWIVMPALREGESIELVYLVGRNENLSLWELGRAVLLGPRQWLYIGQTLLAAGFLPVLARWRLLALFIPMAHMLVMPATLSMDRHYTTLPFAVSIILLMIVLCDVWPRLSQRPHLRRWLGAWLAITVIGALGAAIWRDGRMRLWILRPEPRMAHFNAVARRLPSDARLAASLTAGSRLSHREHLYLWPEMEYDNMRRSPEPIKDAEYILTDRRRETYWKRADSIQALHDDAAWTVVAQAGDFTLFRRACSGERPIEERVGITPNP